MSGEHFLIVPDDPDQAMEVEHPASCPQHGHVESVRNFDDSYACPVEQEVREAGIEASFHHDTGVPLFTTGRTSVLPGRHPIEFGLRLAGEQGSAV